MVSLILGFVAAGCFRKYAFRGNNPGEFVVDCVIVGVVAFICYSLIGC